jgi:hypothetical protein
MPQLLLEGAPFAEFARDLAEADDIAIVVAKGRDDDERPETRAVFAEPPPLVLDAAELARLDELALRLPGRDVLGRIKRREVTTDDLGRAISLDPLGTAIPRSDDPRSVEVEDRVVRDTLDEALVIVGR